MQTYTTIEQSKKLIELGLDAKTSDMYYVKETYPNSDWGVHFGNCISINETFFSYRNGFIIPCWSVGVLLNLLPLGTDLCHRGMSMDNGKEFDVWFAQYENPIDLADIDSHIDIMIEDEEMFNAVFKMVCWMLENNIILKKLEE